MNCPLCDKVVKKNYISVHYKRGACKRKTDMDMLKKEFQFFLDEGSLNIHKINRLYFLNNHDAEKTKDDFINRFGFNKKANNRYKIKEISKLILQYNEQKEMLNYDGNKKMTEVVFRLLKRNNYDLELTIQNENICDAYEEIFTKQNTIGNIERPKESQHINLFENTNDIKFIEYINIYDTETKTIYKYCKPRHIQYDNTLERDWS